MRMSKCLTVVVFSMLMFGVCVPANAALNEDSVHIEYPNGDKSNLTKDEFIRMNGSILVNPNYLINILPFTVPGKGMNWLEAEKALLYEAYDVDGIGERNKGLAIKIGENSFKDYILDRTVSIPQEAILKDGRVYLPLRGIAEAYDHVVNYSKNNGEVLITIQ
jgi:hypothetical protein